MTINEVKRAFPIGSTIKIINNLYNCLIGKELIVEDYQEIYYRGVPAGVLLITNNVGIKSILADTNDIILIRGPAIKSINYNKINHDGMIYNPYTDRWTFL
jgi:hypothetical protein